MPLFVAGLTAKPSICFNCRLNLLEKLHSRILPQKRLRTSLAVQNAAEAGLLQRTSASLGSRTQTAPGARGELGLKTTAFPALTKLHSQKRRGFSIASIARAQDGSPTLAVESGNLQDEELVGVGVQSAAQRQEQGQYSVVQPWTKHQLPDDLHARMMLARRRVQEQEQTPDQDQEQEPAVGQLLRPEGAETAPEEVALRARQMFGDRLPEGTLNAEEYKIYERLYGPPLPEIEEVEEEMEEVVEQEEEEDESTELFKEGADGELQRVEYADESPLPAGVEPNSRHRDNSRLQADIQAALAASTTSNALTIRSPDDLTPYDEPSLELDSESVLDEAEEAEEAEYANEEDSSPTLRTHFFTAHGRFGTSPSTLPLPSLPLTHPISLLLTDIPNKHLDEAASRILGGPTLPYGPCTPYASRTMPQKPIPLSAGQTRMTDMEADVYLAAIMPGVYASVMSALVEVRKRLGSAWIEGLMAREGGPRILDAGAGGAGVIAWREVLKAEWARLHPEEYSDSERGDHDVVVERKRRLDKRAQVPVGKATVLTGSSALRERASVLLDNTTFIPRLPDYAHSSAPAASTTGPTSDANTATPSNTEPSSSSQPQQQARKKFDIILAPHTLWPLTEDYERRQRVHALWNLLDLNGGVLVLLEKGVPRGFEVMAEAREVLLRECFEKSGLTTVGDTTSQAEEIKHDTPISATTTTPSTSSKDARRSPARILAPCTSHTKCPMYHVRGISRQRKDYCHFAQRFARPAYLQRMLGARDRNHDDVRFSYVAVQRGIGYDAHMSEGDNTRGGSKEEMSLLGEKAAERAFQGYDVGDEDLPFRSPSHVSSIPSPTTPIPPNHFTHPPPRLLLPPLKRTGHILLDLCTPSGTLERWTVTRSFGPQPYRDARKAKWGDLWYLGGRFRAGKRVRLGWAHMLEGVGTGRGGEGLREVRDKLAKETGGKKRKGGMGNDKEFMAVVKDVKGRVKAERRKEVKKARSEGRRMPQSDGLGAVGGVKQAVKRAASGTAPSREDYDTVKPGGITDNITSTSTSSSASANIHDIHDFASVSNTNRTPPSSSSTSNSNSNSNLRPQSTAPQSKTNNNNNNNKRGFKNLDAKSAARSRSRSRSHSHSHS